MECIGTRELSKANTHSNKTIGREGKADSGDRRARDAGKEGQGRLGTPGKTQGRLQGIK